MCEALRELMNDEIEEEKRIAVEEATKEIKQVAKEAEKAAEIKVAKAEREVKKTAKETVLTNIRSLMENMEWTAEKAMTALNIPAAEHADYAAGLKTLR